MLNARWISSLDELLSLGEAYDRFVIRAGDYGLFYLRDWVRRIWPFYGAGGDQLAFLLAERDGEPVGLAPLQLQNQGWKHAGLRRLFFFGDVDSSLLNGTPDFLIPDPCDLKPCVQAFAALLAEHSGRWDLLDLNMVSENAPFLAPLVECLPGGRRRLIDLSTPAADLTGGEDTYSASLSSHLRKRLDYQMRKLLRELPEARFSMTPTISPERITRLAALHRQRQSAMRQAGRHWRHSLFDDPLQTRVYADLLDWAGRQGHTRHYWLETGEQIEVFLLCFHAGSTLFYHLTAMTDRIGEYSGGLLLLHWMIEQEALNHGTRLVNMLPGINLTKQRLANRVTPLCQWRAVNPCRALSRLRCGLLETGHRLRHGNQQPSEASLAGEA